MPPPGGAMAAAADDRAAAGLVRASSGTWRCRTTSPTIYALQPFGVQHYKETLDLNYGRVPDDRADLWLKRRNYLVNCMRLVDAQFAHVLDALDRQNLWENTVVIFTGDHGEMNGAHRMTQKGAHPLRRGGDRQPDRCACRAARRASAPPRSARTSTWRRRCWSSRA